jgi:hypothetical protein
MTLHVLGNLDLLARDNFGVLPRTIRAERVEDARLRGAAADCIDDEVDAFAFWGCGFDVFN